MSELYKKPLFCCAIHNRFIGCRMGRVYPKRDYAIAFCGIVSNGVFTCCDDGSSVSVVIDRKTLSVSANGLSGGSAWLLPYKKSSLARLELPVYGGEESWEFFISTRPFDPEALKPGYVKLGEGLFRSVWDMAPACGGCVYGAWYGLPCGAGRAAYR